MSSPDELATCARDLQRYLEQVRLVELDPAARKALLNLHYALISYLQLRQQSPDRAC